MVNDISWSTVILIVSLLFMHMLTLTVLMYKDGISRYCDGVSTEALQFELQRRQAAKRYRPTPLMSAPARPVYPRMQQPLLEAPKRAVPDFQPMYDTTSMPIADCGQWQEPMYSIYGRELKSSEGGVSESAMYSNPYIHAATTGPAMSCKNNNSFFF
jgi:hypothetical protein